ncbi:hypothetical protein VTG60DRAFT_2441 [Thermothelomyces hinnuleus]
MELPPPVSGIAHLAVLRYAKSRESTITGPLPDALALLASAALVYTRAKHPPSTLQAAQFAAEQHANAKRLGVNAQSGHASERRHRCKSRSGTEAALFPIHQSQSESRQPRVLMSRACRLLNNLNILRGPRTPLVAFHRPTALRFMWVISTAPLPQFFSSRSE